MNARLLVVDDEPHVVRILSHRLEESGYEVHVASNGRDALTVLGSVEIDLLITDLCMPQLHGVELCRTVRADAGTSDLPILVLTALGGSRIPDELKRDVVVIPKPIDMDRLLEAVRHALEAGRDRKHRPEAA